MSDIDELRHSFRPKPITTLFVGESPPYGRTFFYKGDSLLYYRMKESFGDIDHFLLEFKAKGFFLDDLVLYPINHIRGDDERNAHRWRGVPSLARRMAEYQPVAVVALMSAIKAMVEDAMRTAGLSHVPLYVTPFPRHEHQRRFKAMMAEIIPKLPHIRIESRPRRYMYRWSQLFIPTLREAPADAEVASHKYLVRAGYIRQLAAGLYSFLFLGQRSKLKITQVVREEMDKIGQEFYLPALNPRELWEMSGRWTAMGENMFRLKDRSGRELCLGMTHEEGMTEIARKEVRSYKELPQIWYQIQQKFRDEPRPKSGLLRVRQFTMKDSYSFDIDAAGLDVSYKKHDEAYRRIFDRCGLKYVVVEAHSGAMGGSQSNEFMVMTDAGEDFVASCQKCGYAANLEKATSRLEPVEDLAPTGDGKPELVHTPGLKSVEEVAKYLGISPKQKMKTMAYMAVEEDGKTGKSINRPVIAFVRGDHQLNEAKLSSAVEGRVFRPMHPEEIQEIFGSPAGFLGPIGIPPSKNKYGPPIVLVDAALQGRTNLVSGANKEDYHLRNITPGRDFVVERWVDLRTVSEGEACPNCGAPLVVGTAVEIGHIFKLGYKYSESMGARVLDKDGKEVTPIMGCYGIGIERILTAAIEQNHDNDGFWLPPQIAPFEIIVTPTNFADANIKQAAIEITENLEAAGFDVLLDDRDERPGVKFKDADLVGMPFRVTVGRKVSEGKVEVVERSTRKIQDATISSIASHFAQVLRPAG